MNELTQSKLRRAVMMTASAHEKSWSHEESKYTVSLEQCAARICESLKIDVTLAPLIWLALSGAWGDILAWAEDEYDEQFKDGKLIEKNFEEKEEV